MDPEPTWKVEDASNLLGCRNSVVKHIKKTKWTPTSYKWRKKHTKKNESKSGNCGYNPYKWVCTPAYNLGFHQMQKEKAEKIYSQMVVKKS